MTSPSLFNASNELPLSRFPNQVIIPDIAFDVSALNPSIALDAGGIDMVNPSNVLATSLPSLIKGPGPHLKSPIKPTISDWVWGAQSENLVYGFPTGPVLSSRPGSLTSFISLILPPSIPKALFPSSISFSYLLPFIA